MGFYDMILGEKGLLVELRCKNSFNEQIYAGIVNILMRICLSGNQVDLYPSQMQ